MKFHLCSLQGRLFFENGFEGVLAWTETVLLRRNFSLRSFPKSESFLAQSRHFWVWKKVTLAFGIRKPFSFRKTLSKAIGDILKFIVVEFIHKMTLFLRNIKFFSNRKSLYASAKFEKFLYIIIVFTLEISMHTEISLTFAEVALLPFSTIYVFDIFFMG